MTPTPPAGDDISRLVATMRTSIERLTALTGEQRAVAVGVDGTELSRTIDEIGHALMEADEELRVQDEEIGRSTRRLDLLLAMQDELFDRAPVAYLQTDANGVIQRLNLAARRLLALDVSPGRSLMMASLVETADRGRVREIVSRLRTAAPDEVVGRTEPIEVVLRRGDGSTLPAVVTARPAPATGSSGRTLHWSIEGAEPRAEAGTTADRSARPEARPLSPADGGMVPPRSGGGAAVLQAITDAVARIDEQTDLAAAQELVVVQAGVATPPGCHIALRAITSRGRSRPVASADEWARLGERLQDHHAEGPGLDAVRTHERVLVRDFAGDPRWPNFAPECARQGLRSALMVPLSTGRQHLGVLAVWSDRPDAFDDDATALAQSYATHVALALRRIEMERNLRTGLATRQVIGQAVGILMERHRIDEQSAFDLIVLASQDAHVKVRDVAARIVETGEEPVAVITERR